MTKKIIILFLVTTLTVMLAACSGGNGGGNSGGSKAKQPEGLYMLACYCNGEGEYVAELNEITDYYGRETTELQKLYEQKKTTWCDILADGTGTYHWEGQDALELSFEPEKSYIWIDGIFYEYQYDAEKDAFWYGADDFWYYMKSCTQQELDFIFAGKGGSVPFDQAEVGDLVCIGNYETIPYNDETEPLFWRVLDKQDGKLLILCDQLIDSFSFNYDPDGTGMGNITWQDCSLRQFLNNEFLEMQFTEEERALIQTTHIENKAANAELLEQWGTWEDRDGIPYSEQTKQNRSDDPDTDDKVFLLSYQEVLKYFGAPTEEYKGNSGYPLDTMKTNPKWQARVTKAVEENGIGFFDYNTRYGAWMTRTLSSAKSADSALVTYITSEGQVYNYYTNSPMFIRPAMWIQTGN